jgi:hypothetical protein
MRDYCGDCTDCMKTNMPNKTPCYHGNMGCRKISETGAGVYN